MVERVQTRNMTREARERKRKITSSADISQCNSEPESKKPRIPPEPSSGKNDRQGKGDTASNGVNGTTGSAKPHQSSEKGKRKRSSVRESTSKKEKRASEKNASQDSQTNGERRSQDHRKDRRRRSDSSGAVQKDQNLDEKRVRDDHEGHLIITRGDVLQARYKMLQKLGEGAFGQVMHCHDMARDTKVALKIIKNTSKYREAARMEINVLRKIHRRDPDGRSLCVRMFDYFDFYGHVCISFEVLGLSVFDYLKDSNYAPYHFSEVRDISYQLCQAVAFLHRMQLTHTDLKPENILLVNSDFNMETSSSGKVTRRLKDRRIRLIDFGSATFDHEHHCRVVCTRHYRAPEVILELGWAQPCDVWSVGCIMFEMYTGNTLFQTHDSIEHLAMMERTLGKLPYRMIEKTPKRHYFDGENLRFFGRLSDRHCMPLRKYGFPDCGIHACRCRKDLLHLMTKMLEYEPKYRMKASKALEHPFFSRSRRKFAQTSQY